MYLWDIFPNVLATREVSNHRFVVFVTSLLPLNPSEQVQFRRKVSLALKERFRHREQMDAG